MRNLKACWLIILLFTLILTGCHKGQYAYEGYLWKIQNGEHDKSVKIEYRCDEREGELNLKFKAKQIPYEMDLICGSQTNNGRYDIVGSLGGGSIFLSLVNSAGQELWKKTYEAGDVNDSSQFDIGPGEYMFRLEFDEAKAGDIKFTYYTN